MNGNGRLIAFGKIGAIVLVACAWSTRATAGSSADSCWSTPTNVGAPLNTPYNDSYAVLTKDGLTVYFTSNRPGGLGGDDLWMATRDSVDLPWNTPTNLAVLNSPANDSLPMLSHSENVMWFTSDRPGGWGGSDLWQAKRNPHTGDWDAPINLGWPVNTTYNENAPAFYANDELGLTTLYFGSTRPGGLGDFDVYETTTAGEDLYNATWTPGVLVPNISSPKRDTRTWIRRDGRELFITSNRDGSQGAACPGPGGVPVPCLDIWYSTREANTDPWSTPINLGTPINSTFDEGSPSLTRDGNTLYFFSTRSDLPGALGGRDIWTSQRIPCP